MAPHGILRYIKECNNLCYKMPHNRNSAPVTRNVEVFLDKAIKTRALKVSNTGRIIFALDATASRQPTWDIATLIQKDMFQHVVSIGQLDIKLLYYRGLSECQVSKWVSNSHTLKKLMTRVTCKAGLTQIRKVLNYANLEAGRKNINALIFIGDSVEEPLDGLVDSAAKLGLLGIPLFVFHEGGDIVSREAFVTLARLTRGECFSFDSSSPQTLSLLLQGVASFVVGGPKSLENFARENGTEGLLIARKIVGGK